MIWLGLIFSACSAINMGRGVLKHQLNGVEVIEETRTLSNHTIHFWHGGGDQRDPVLVLHGFGGDALFTWSKTVPDLSKRRKVVLPDLIWFGESISKGEPTLALQTEAVLTLMSDLGYQQFDVIGISYGGLVAMNLAMSSPESIDQMIIVDSPGPFIDDEAISSISERFDVDSIHEIFVPDTPKDIQRLIDLLFCRRCAQALLLSYMRCMTEAIKHRKERGYYSMNYSM